MRPTARMNRFTLRRLYFWLAVAGWVTAAFLYTTGVAHADPYCGAGSNWTGANGCGPGMPKPAPGYLPYPGPGQGTSNTGGYPNNSSNYPGYGGR